MDLQVESGKVCSGS